jgi:hypothetical protein
MAGASGPEDETGGATAAPRPRLVELAARAPFVPILLAIGGVTLCASLFATWFGVQRGSFSGVQGPSTSQIRALTEAFDQTGWEYWDGGDVALFVLGAGLVALATYDAVRHQVPHPVLALAAFLCAIALGVLLAEGFSGDRVLLVEGTLGEAAGQVVVDRSRAGGQWVALIGLVVALGGLGLGWRERRPDAVG